MLLPSTGRPSPNGNGVNNGPRDPADLCTIREVWASNLDEEFYAIMHLVQGCNQVGQDTEFPGLLVRPTDPQLPKPCAYHYSLMRENRIWVKLVQLVFSFFDENPQPAPDDCAWQFHFKYNVEDDVCDPIRSDL
ncbi:CCR4-NOT transcription complex subunit 7-like [Haemaphysalis longicornis]